MPYVLNNQDEEDKNKVPGTDAAGLGGEGGQNMPSPQQSGLSGWTDVHAYLDANKDQSLGMAQNLGQKLGGEADALKTDISAGEKSFEDAAGQNRIDLDQGKVDKAFENPADFTKDENNVADFTKMRDASYKGPNNFSESGDFGTISARTKEGAARANLIDTDAGRQSLLFEGPGNPTKGQVTLDSLLIAGNPESRDVMKAGAGHFAGIEDFLNQNADKANTAAAGAKATTEATSKSVKDRLAQETGNFKQGVTSRLEQTKAQQKAIVDSARTKLLAGQDLTDEEINALGGAEGGKGAYQNYRNTVPALLTDYGIKADPSNFYSEQSPDNAFSLENTSSPEDFAKAAALAKLSGQDLGILGPDKASLAGTAPKGLGSFNFSGAQGDAQKQLRQNDVDLIQGSAGGGPANPSAQDKQKYIDAYTRNFGELNNNQVMWLQSQGVDIGKYTGQGQGGGATGTSSRYRTTNGSPEWFDGKTWVAAPEEFKQLSDGTWQQFNYDTGQYTTIDKKPTAGFGSTPGVY